VWLPVCVVCVCACACACAGDGTVMSWGCGAWGALGHEDVADRHVPTVIKALSKKRIKHISCGGSHCVALAGTAHSLSHTHTLIQHTRTHTHALSHTHFHTHTF